MGRKPRIEYYGAIYLIIQKLDISHDNDKMMFLKIVGEVREIFDFKLLAYSIIDDSYYFVLKTLNIPLSQIMHRINTRYSKYFGLEYKIKGSPFKGRYISNIVKGDNYLYSVINYVHNISVYLEKVKNMEQYKWSSDFFYRMNLESIVDINYILESLSIDRNVARSKYIGLMNLNNCDYLSLKNQYESSSYIGDDIRIDLDDLLKSICPGIEEYNLIKSGSRKSYLMEYKERYIKECKRHNYNNREIGNSIGLGDRAIRSYLKKL